MKKILLIFLFNLSIIALFSQEIKTFGDETNLENEYCFSIRLLPDMSNNLYQCAILKKNSKLSGNVEYLALNTWILQAAGYESSIANPDRINYFIRYKVFEVPEKAKNKGNNEMKYYTLNKAKANFNNLWILKYSEYPFFNTKINSEKGWASHPDPQITWLPSESQMNILRTSFGIKELGDFINDENAFKLLKNVRDRDWQSIYLQSAGVYSGENNDSIPNN